MKRPIADAASFMAICSIEENNGAYLEDEDEAGEAAATEEGLGKKKRRLSVEQVRALEKSFEVENKLESERKLSLAEELGLQPRQVAVWFQNRRARWKTKQLERDYAALRAGYDALRLDYDALSLEKEALVSQIEELKAKLGREESASFVSLGPVASKAAAAAAASSEADPAPELIYKDAGSSDSSISSDVLNGANSPGQPNPPRADANSSVPISPPQFPLKGQGFPRQTLKPEEEFLDREDGFSSIFSDEQPPTLNWYFSDHWNCK